ncbi:hypothetical protein ACETU7_05470 [Rhodococcus sp. 3Y1]
MLSRASEVRNCFAVVGPDNLVVQLWLHSPAELDAFETRLRKEIPGLCVTERSIVLYLRKLLGHVLDQQGRRTDTVAPDVAFRFTSVEKPITRQSPRPPGMDVGSVIS